MQVTMNIDANQIGDTVLEMFSALTAEEKKTIALNVVREWVLDPAKFESSSIDAMALRHCRQKANHWETYTDQEWRCREEYRKFINANPNSKEGIILAFRDEFSKYAKEEVTKLVREDTRVQVMLDGVVEVVAKAFPKLAMDAVVLWCAANMDKAVNAAINGLGIEYISRNDGTGQDAFPKLRADMGAVLSQISEKAGIKP